MRSRPAETETTFQLGVIARHRYFKIELRYNFYWRELYHDRVGYLQYLCI